MLSTSLVGTVIDQKDGDTNGTPWARVTLKYQKQVFRKGEAPQLGDRYITVIGFRQAGEALRKVQKGTLLWVEGEPQASRPYQDKEGAWKSSLEILASDVLPVASGASSGGEGRSARSSAPTPAETGPDFDDPFEM
jgi:single-stranded DNA-binding protein